MWRLLALLVALFTVPASSQTLGTLGAGSAASATIAGTTTVIFLIAGSDTSPWTVPANWNNSNNKIEVIGGGGGAGWGQFGTSYGAGGGGGAYSKATNVALSGTVSFSIGAAGAIAGSHNNAGSAGGET
jgi:hypothetical protein